MKTKKSYLSMMGRAGQYTGIQVSRTGTHHTRTAKERHVSAILLLVIDKITGIVFINFVSLLIFIAKKKNGQFVPFVAY